MLTSTRTHTVLWDEESLAPLNKAIAELYVDLKHRGPHISGENKAAMLSRLTILKAAASQMLEPTPYQ